MPICDNRWKNVLKSQVHCLGYVCSIKFAIFKNLALKLKKIKIKMEQGLREF